MKATILTDVLLTAALLALAGTALAQGPLAPPGAPAPTFKTLQQIEPRTPISSLPFTINQPGSYYLTTNLVGPLGSSNGITITAGEVTLDLMGFRLSGANSTGSGIVAAGYPNSLCVRNGSVSDWPVYGVDLFSALGSVLEKLRVSRNGSVAAGAGLRIGLGGRLIDCAADINRGIGMEATFDGNLSGCTAFDNGTVGITVGEGGTVRGCTATFNDSVGIAVGAGSTVMGCTARGNGGDGISAAAGSTIRDCTATGNTGDGIEVTEDCRVVENTCHENGYLTGNGAGIRVTGQKNRIDSNQATDNDRGIHATAIRNFIVRNSARANGSNYVIVAGNRIAQIVQPAVNAADIPHANTGNTNGFTGVDPWANFSH